MGGRGGFSNMFSVGIGSGKRVSPSIYESMVKDNAKMILLSLPKSEPVQIILRKSFREGKETVELVGSSMQTFATNNLSVDRLESWLYRLNKEFQKSRKELRNGMSAKAYDDVTSRMRATKQITRGLKKLIKAKKGINNS